MKLSTVLISVGGGLILGGSLSLMTGCGSTSELPLPADTVHVNLGSQWDHGYVKEVQLPSGTRCVILYSRGRSSSIGGGLDCDFPRDSNEAPQADRPLER